MAQASDGSVLAGILADPPIGSDVDHNDKDKKDAYEDRISGKKTEIIESVQENRNQHAVPLSLAESLRIADPVSVFGLAVVNPHKNTEDTVAGNG